MRTKIRQYLKQCPPRLFSSDKITVGRIDHLGAGEMNDNFLVQVNGREYVFRIPVTSKSQAKEYRILSTVSKLDVAPRPVLLDASRRHFDTSVMILEFIPGEALPPDWQLTDEQFRALAQELAALHKVPIKNLRLPSSGLTYPEYFKRLKKYERTIKGKLAKHGVGSDSAKALGSAIRTLESRKYPKNVRTITHGDMAPQNLVACNEGFQFIDWAGGGIGDPAQEIVFITDDVGFPMSREQKMLFIREYEACRDDPTLRERMDAFIPLSRLELVLWTIERIYAILDKELHPRYLKKSNLADLLGFYDDCSRRLAKTGIINAATISREQAFPARLARWGRK